MLYCRNCGGRIVVGQSPEIIICENCGKSQSIQSITSATATPLYVPSKEISKALNTYQRAMNMFTQGQSVQTLNTAAHMFKNIPDTLNAKEMAGKCLEKSEGLAKENSYRQAMEEMASGESKRISGAIETFHLLSDYKDAPRMKAQAHALLQTVLQQEQEQEKAKRRAARIKRLAVVGVLLAVVLTVVLVATSRSARYDSDNLELSISPCRDYLTVKSNRYIFYYEVEMENEGTVDIQAFTADVIIEDENGKILVDTQMQAQDANALVRKGKSREMTWELMVRDENVALALYEDFDDLEVSIKVTQIQFADGEEKDY